MARQFLDHDFDVLICADGDGFEGGAERLPGTRGSIDTVRTDLSTYDGVEQLHSAISATGRPVDALALNAGFGNGGKFLDIDLDDELRLIQTNIVAVVHTAKRVLPAMVARGEGRILITASVASTMPGPYYATYAASKAL